jgi:hypothetical protein
VGEDKGSNVGEGLGGERGGMEDVRMEEEGRNKDGTM